MPFDQYNLLNNNGAHVATVTDTQSPPILSRAGYQIESGWYDTAAWSGALVLY